MAKAGSPFENVVAEVMRAIDSDANVQQGKWVDGPDGRRELDVVVDGTVSGRYRKTLIECKDFNPKSTGPVGIEYVDALDSKRRDLAVDVAMICSNAGFTGPAIRKAKRVGITLIGAFRENDGRIRHQVIDEVYFRRVKIEYLGFRIDGMGVNKECRCLDSGALYNGKPIANWVCHHVRWTITSNPITAGLYQGPLTFKYPIECETKYGDFVATSLFVEFRLSGGWFAQKASIDGTAGVYDHIRRRVRLGTGISQLHIKGMDLTAGEPIDFPPSNELDISVGNEFGEVWTQLLYILNCKCHEPIPPLEEVVIASDLDAYVSNLRPELQIQNTGQSRSKLSWYQCENPKVGPNHVFTWTITRPARSTT